jgi:hypothetical protein
MAAWRLNDSLTLFRDAVNRAYPNRDKTTDGTIGDEAHQNTDSDHNPDADGTVDAWDMDVDLRSGNDPATIERLKSIFQAHPAARYWIHNGQIAHRNASWARRPYTGSNKHTKHVHWNTNQATENSTAPWVIEEDDLTPEQAAQLRDTHFTAARAIPNPLPGATDRVPLHVWAAWMTGATKALTSAVTAIANTVADEEVVNDLQADLQLLAERVSQYAAAEQARDAQASTERAEIAHLLAELDAGNLTQDELVGRIRVQVEAVQPTD